MSLSTLCTAVPACLKSSNLALRLNLSLSRKRCSKLIILTLLSGLYSQAYAAPGDLDTSFGQAGRVALVEPGSAGVLSSAAATVVQADNKIIAVGELDGDFFITRLNSNGTPDLSFGTRGSTTTAFPTRDADATAVALQRDGKIIVIGSAFLNGTSDFAAARYNTNGTLDSSFGNGGKLLTDFGGSDIPAALAIQRDGKIIMTGSTNEADPTSLLNTSLNFVVVRYNTDGKVDLGFGDRRSIPFIIPFGRVIIDFFGNDDGAQAIALQQDGKIVVAGGANKFFNSNPDFALIRFNPDGSLDKTFGTDGRLTTKFNSQPLVDTREETSSAAVAVAIQSDGKILAGGTALISQPHLQFFTLGFVLARYTADGRPDIQFGTNGIVLPDFGGDVSSMELQANGKIVMGGALSDGIPPNGLGTTGGFQFNAGGSRFTLVRYTRDGRPDSSFGNGGQVITEFNPVFFPFGAQVLPALALQPDGKIIAVVLDGLRGFFGDQPGPSGFVVARYLGDPVPVCFGRFSTLVGSSVRDVLTGTVDQDVISSLEGDDTVYAGDGNDLICAGPGNDLVFGHSGNNLVNGEAGDDLIFGGTDNSLMMGGSGNDTLAGGNSNDIIFAGDGQDIVLGGIGNDLLMGEAGNDFLYGSDGNDYLHGGIGGDFLNGGNQTDICLGGVHFQGDITSACEIVNALP